MAGLTSAGFEAPSLAEIKARIEAALRENVSPTLDLDPSSPMGEAVDIFAREVRLAWESGAALYGSLSRAGASGRGLDILSALTGTYRREATYSTTFADITVEPGTYPAGTLIASVAGRPQDRFVNTRGIVNSSAGLVSATLPFRAESPGPVQAPANTLTVMASPVSGWIVVENTSDAILGSVVEGDPSLRERGADEVAAQGSTTADAIRADISQNVAGIEQVIVLENDTDTTDANGVPPHAIEVIAYGPAAPSGEDDQALAEQIYRSKSAGTGTAGGTTVVVTNDQGFDKDLRFTRPADVDVKASLSIQTDPLTYPGDLTTRSSLALAAQAASGVGDDFDWSDLVAWVMALPGVLRVTAVSVAAVGDTLVSFGAVPVSIREIARLSSGDITISSTPGTA